MIRRLEHQGGDPGIRILGGRPQGHRRPHRAAPERQHHPRAGPGLGRDPGGHHLDPGMKIVRLAPPERRVLPLALAVPPQVDRRRIPPPTRQRLGPAAEPQRVLRKAVNHDRRPRTPTPSCSGPGRCRGRSVPDPRQTQPVAGPRLDWLARPRARFGSGRSRAQSSTRRHQHPRTPLGHRQPQADDRPHSKSRNRHHATHDPLVSRSNQTTTMR
jgi:hypothetical protein